MKQKWDMGRYCTECRKKVYYVVRGFQIMSKESGTPDCNCEYSQKYRVTEWGDIVPMDISEEELEALRRKRGQ